MLRPASLLNPVMGTMHGIVLHFSLLTHDAMLSPATTEAMKLLPAKE